jgi:hypothetical protein
MLMCFLDGVMLVHLIITSCAYPSTTLEPKFLICNLKLNYWNMPLLGGRLKQLEAHGHSLFENGR